jgi:hypothetical protein
MPGREAEPYPVPILNQWQPADKLELTPEFPPPKSIQQTQSQIQYEDKEFIAVLATLGQRRLKA